MFNILVSQNYFFVMRGKYGRIFHEHKPTLGLRENSWLFE